MSSEEPKGKAPADDEDGSEWERMFRIVNQEVEKEMSGNKEVYEHIPTHKFHGTILAIRICARLTHDEMVKLRVGSAKFPQSMTELRQSLAALKGVFKENLMEATEALVKIIRLEAKSHALRYELEVEKRRTDALVADIKTIKSELDASKTVTEPERRPDALMEENKTLKCELDSVKSTIDEKIKAAIEQCIPANLKGQLEKDTDDIALIDKNLRATDEDLQSLWLKVLDQEAWASGLVETSSDEDDGDDDDSEKGDLGGGEGEGDPHDGTDDNEESNNGDDSDHSEESEDGEDGDSSDGSDGKEGSSGSDGSHESEDGGGKGSQDDSESENESERWSLAGQVGVWEDIHACGASDGVGENHNGAKRHEYNDCCGHGKGAKPDTGDLPPFSSEQQVLEKVRKIRQSRSKQPSTTREETPLANWKPLTGIPLVNVPTPQSQSTAPLRESSALGIPSSGTPSSGTNITAQLVQQRHSDGLAAELKKEVETAKVAAMKEIAVAARRVDEKADKLDQMMLEFETRMAQAYPSTQAADVTLQSPIITDEVPPWTSSPHTGIREIRYDLRGSDNAAKESTAATTASSSQTSTAPKSLPAFFSARKIMRESLFVPKARIGSTSGIPEMGDSNKWPSEWPMYWEGGDPTGLGRERKGESETGEAGDTSKMGEIPGLFQS